jgi:hypothetical protein
MALAMALKCTAQAASMMRQSHSAIRSLQQMQAIRIKRDSNETAAAAAALAEHIAASSMTTRLSPPAAPEPAEAPPPLEPEQPPAPEIAMPKAAMRTAEPPQRSDAEIYAILHPRRAALIRRHGGVPPDATFGPPDDDLVRALLESRSPVVLAVDSED